MTGFIIGLIVGSVLSFMAYALICVGGDDYDN